MCVPMSSCWPLSFKGPFEILSTGRQFIIIIIIICWFGGAAGFLNFYLLVFGGGGVDLLSDSFEYFIIGSPYFSSSEETGCPERSTHGAFGS